MSDSHPTQAVGSPGGITALAAVGAGVVGVIAGAAGGSGPLPAAAATSLLGLGLYRESRGLLAVGSLGLVATAVVNGITPGPAVAVPLAIGAGVLAWDAGTTSLDLQAQLPPEARSRRLEGLHVVVAVGVVTLGVAVAVAGPRLVGAVGSAGAAFLLLAVIGLLVALNNLR
jgi:hypothetical protein